VAILLSEVSRFRAPKIRQAARGCQQEHVLIVECSPFRLHTVGT
jgi:hypothetical protein